MWAVPGTDTCLKHGGKIPQTIAEADQRVAEARKRLIQDEHASRRADDAVFWLVQDETVAFLTQTTIDYNGAIRERIETKLEEFKEAYPEAIRDGYHYDDGIIDGLTMALDILDES
jgi:hypothetical protein